MYKITQQQKQRYNRNRRAKRFAQTSQQRQIRLAARREYQRIKRVQGGHARRQRDRRAKLAYVNKIRQQNPNFQSQRYAKSKLAKDRRAAQAAKNLKPGQRICSRCRFVRPQQDFPTTRTGDVSTMCNKCYTVVTGGCDLSSDVFWKRLASTINVRAKKRAQTYDSQFSLVTPQQLRSIYAQQGGKCRYCGLQLNALIMAHDHKVPLSRGGAHSKDNLQLLCHNCNVSKFTMTDQQYQLYVK